MKILQVSSAKTFGGGERHLVDLCRELTVRGHEVFVVLRPTNEWQERLDFLPPENIFHASIRNAFGIFSAQRIARFVRARNIEIVHAHAARDYIPAGLVCRMSKNTKFVLTRHVLFPMKPFHRIALRNLSRAIAVSRTVAQNLRAVFPPQKIEIISNGLTIDQDFDRRKKREEFRFFHEIPFDAPLVGTIGELKLLKGQQDFVLAAAEIVKKHGEARFLIVGRDHSAGESFRRELKRLVKVFGLEKNFLFLDWTDDLPAVFSALDIFVSASHTESFGLAILEAMIRGVPLVATMTEGAKELLEDGRSASLVPVKEPLKLAEGVIDLLENPSKAQNFAQTAQTFAAENFSLDKMVDATERLYEKIKAEKS